MRGLEDHVNIMTTMNPIPESTLPLVYDQMDPAMARGARARRTQKSWASATTSCLLLLFVASTTPIAMAQNCVSLSGSQTCPAFNRSSISTGPGLVST